MVEHTTKPRVALLGCGAMGQRLAPLFAAAEVSLWGRRRPPTLPPALAQLRWCEDVADACAAADAVVFALPIAALRQVARAYGAVARGDQQVFYVARGVEPDFILPHQVLRQETCTRQLAVLGGSLRSLIAAPEPPSALLVGSRYPGPAQSLRAWTQALGVQITASADLVGIEVAGALEPVTALAIGMAEALQLGASVRGLLQTRGLAEAARLAEALGGAGNTFALLAGMGSLVLPPDWQQEAHVQLGLALGAGQPQPAALDAPTDAPAHLDGLRTAAALPAVARAHHLQLPLMEAVAAVLAGTQTPATALRTVLQRGLQVGEP